ncbi:hypothetical protein FXO38_16853 [Capsicum annuum]|nr:hypothetical protein FXO38_16853 [Capsicum annuum]KAF3653189.1 hypothetical protein FXO37_17114 [Capsicum annuum]
MAEIRKIINQTLGVLEIPSIYDMREARWNFDIRLIHDASNLLVMPMRQKADAMVGLFSQDNLTDIAATAEATEIGTRITNKPTDVAGTSSVPLPVQSVPPRPWGMPTGVMLISQAAWTEVMT